MYPSWIVPAPEGPNLGALAATPVTIVNGRPYLIGEAARLHTVSLFSQDKATDSLTQALTWAGTARLLSPGYHVVRLGVGLPLAWYATQKSALSQSLQGRVTVDDRHLDIPQVTVFPQGIGALLTADLPENGLVGLVNIGYRTVDYLVAPIRDGVPAPMINRSGTGTGGMHHAYTTPPGDEVGTVLRCASNPAQQRQQVTQGFAVKRNQTGSQPTQGFWPSHDVPQAKTLVLVEAPIDAMALYAALCPDGS